MAIARPQGPHLVHAKEPVRSDSGSESLVRSATRKAALRLIPILAVGYGLACVDRVNVSFAALRMNADLHFSATVYGFGAGLFFVGYALCEVPSNLMLLRFGARRWLSSILLAWGLLSTAMMLVRTPFEFNVLRLLLGIAEAGFFPGAIYYLTLWFPSGMRARVVSRFYVAAPLSIAVMGSLAGWLLSLNGRLGLTGWQWLFLVEGIPAALYSLVIWGAMPDGPGEARWLTQAEKDCLQRRLDLESGNAELGHGASVLQSLLSPKVWMIGMFFFCVLTCNYAYQMSAPAILLEATGWTVGRVGTVIALLGLAGGAGMLLNGIHSDRSGERSLHCIVPCLVMAAGFLLAGNAHAGWATVAGLGASFIAIYSLLGPAVALPTEFLSGKAAAAGIAAMNTITMFSGFVGPYWVGVMRDATGNYEGAMSALFVPSLIAAGIMFFLTRSLARSRASAFLAAEIARQSA